MSKGPDQLTDPMACRNCGESKPHGLRWAEYFGVHPWSMPTELQIKYRMIRRRKWHAATRWVRPDGRTRYRKW